MERKIRKNSGITLITLIVTIVVMLILVAVSVRVVKNSDLIGVAKQAGKLTEEAKEKEKSGKVTIGEVEYDSIEDYVYGEAPKVTVTTFGKAITISLTDSYENYISQKSIAEKEQALAEYIGYENIEAVIENYYEGSREAYEADVIFDYGVETYEEALKIHILDRIILREEYYATVSGKNDVVVNVGDAFYQGVSKLSTEEKEQAYAEYIGYENIDALIGSWFGGSREEYGAAMKSYYGVETYEEALNWLYIREVMGIDRYYYLEYSDTRYQKFEIAPSYGTYAFTATDEETGRTKEITVTTKKEMGTLTIKYNGEVLGSFEFEKGITLEKFVKTFTYDETNGQYILNARLKTHGEVLSKFWVDSSKQDMKMCSLDARLRWEGLSDYNILLRDSYVLEELEGEE